MSKMLVSYLLVVLCLHNSLGQGMNRLWCFGDSARLTFDTIGNVSVGYSSVVSRGTCASISDSLGNLLFYSNTIAGQSTSYEGYVWNNQDALMKNGDSLASRGWYKQHIILPYPNSDSLFLLMQAVVTGIGGLYYSLIDMTGDSGRGEVIQKNVQLQGANFWSNDGLAAIKHGNGRDWWVICRHYELPANNEYLFYLVNSDSIYLHHTQFIGDTIQAGFFRIEPSLDGSKIACSDLKGTLVIYDYDRCTGILSNEVYLEHDQNNANFYPWYFDCELSSNNRYLYVSQSYSDFDTTNYLLRFDLQAPNIAASRDTLYAGEQSAIAGLIELAPDGKMYWSCAYNPPNTYYYPYPDSVHNYITDNLSVINYPDSSFCDLQPFSFYLGGKRTYYGLPNNPNYNLGRLIGSPCDTLLWASTPKPSHGGLNAGDLKCTYISSWSKLFVNASGVKGKDVTVTIYDTRGSLKFKVASLKNNAGYVTLDVDCGAAGSPSGVGGARWSNGIYIVNLQSEKESLSVKFIKQ